jgi:hypothetical protein
MDDEPWQVIAKRVLRTTFALMAGIYVFWLVVLLSFAQLQADSQGSLPARDNFVLTETAIFACFSIYFLRHAPHFSSRTAYGMFLLSYLIVGCANFVLVFNSGQCLVFGAFDPLRWGIGFCIPPLL